MKLLSAEFIKSCTDAEDLPQDRAPEVAIVGRSNVGKSSLINSLLHRKRLAKVSGTPGKTRLLNIIRVTTDAPGSKTLYLVDLPGYGYAKVAKSMRLEWGSMIERYLTDRDQLRGVLMLVDIRRAEIQDRGTLEWLRRLGREPVVIVTKADKLTRGQRQGRLSEIRDALNLTEEELITYSSETHEGRDDVWRAIQRLIAGSQAMGTRL